jgi:anti-anti-sigma regulatory factor
MHLESEMAQGRVPVTILSIHGALDASNYEELVGEAKKLYQAGTRHLVLDMSDMPFMSSSGLVALHSIALLLRGDTPPDPEMGWQAFHSLGHDREGGVQPHVKLLSPQPKVLQTLQITSMTDIFEIFSDRQAALDSF